MRERYYLLKGKINQNNNEIVSSNGIPVHAAVCLYRSIAESGAAGCNIYGGKDTIAGICEELESAGASHVDTFREWTTDFADTAGKNAGLEDSWSDPGKMKADIGKCMDGWEQNHDYSDADCRMTAFLLLDGVLRAESTEDSYEGTYLMFDTEAIDNVDRYESIKENKNMFTTLYGEKVITDGSHPENTFSDSWKHYGFQVG